MMLFLGRLCNLLLFVFITGLSLNVMPYGKHVTAMVMLLPITLQQAASASYDPMLIAGIVLFIAMILRASEEGVKNWYMLVALLVLALFIAVTKGGVYMPLCVLIFAVHYWFTEGIRIKKSVLGVIAAVLILGAVVAAGYPIYRVFMNGGAVRESEALYTFSDILASPFKVICLFWNTIFVKSQIHVAGLLGGKLSWLDVSIKWPFLLAFFVILLMLANTENDKFSGNRKLSVFLIVTMVFSVGLIMSSMLVGFTTLSATSIQGLQGRYYLPLFPAMFFFAKTDMVDVKKYQAGKLEFTFLILEIAAILQVVPQVM